MGECEVVERRFVSFNFERGTISAYVAIAGNRPLRVARLDCGTEEGMRQGDWGYQQIEDFRRDPTRFGRPPEGTTAA